MSTPNLKREHDYKSFSNFALNPTNWNYVMSDPDNGIGPRLVSLEAREASVQAFLDLGTTLVVQLVADNISPYLTAVQVTINGLNSQLEALEDAQAAIIGGGIPAANVTVTPISGLAATNTQAALSQLKTAVDANAAAILAQQNETLALIIALG